jgi:hypothetical protein
MPIQENGIAVRKLISIIDAPMVALELRVAAAQGLGRAGGLEALNKLIALVDAPMQALELRTACARAIGEAGRLQ